MIEINESNFEQETNQGLVLVDFTAPWCGPCRLLAPVLEQLEGIKVVKVNVDENNDLAQKHHVTSIPLLVFMKDGVAVERSVGLLTKEAIQKKVDNLKG